MRFNEAAAFQLRMPSHPPKFMLPALCFNEAAAFQLRMRLAMTGHCPLVACFNEAAAFQLRMLEAPMTEGDVVDTLQ